MQLLNKCEVYFEKSIFLNMKFLLKFMFGIIYSKFYAAE